MLPSTNAIIKILSFGFKLFWSTFSKINEILDFEHYEKEQDEIQNFGIGVCREGHADSNKKTVLSSFKTLAGDRFEDMVKNLKMSKILFSKLKSKKSKSKKCGIAVYISLPNFKTPRSIIKNLEIFTEGPYKLV